MLPHLVEECTKYLWSDLYPKNACRAYEFAKLFEEPMLMDKCIRIICNQTQEVLSESSFDDVELSTILTVFDQEELNINSELELFSAITRYAARHNQSSGAKVPRLDGIGNATSEANSNHPTIRDAIMKIRFLTLSPQQFAEGPGKSNLLSESEKFAILMNICTPSAAVLMPEGFSTSTIPRRKKHPSESFCVPVMGSFMVDSLFDGTDRTIFHPHVELPYPIHKPFRATDIDAVKQLLIEKSNYLKLLEAKRKRFKVDRKVIVNKKIGNSEYMYLPRHLLEFYKNKDPDTYFNCDYNFYYTGGVLECLQINGGDYLIRPDVENNLCLNDLRNPSFITTLDSDCLTPIFNINSVKCASDHLLVLREKHHVSVKKLINTEKICKLWENKYSTPVLDAKLNQEKSVHIGVVLSNLKLNVTDIETNKTAFSFHNNNNRKADNFQQFQFINNNNIILMDRFVLKILDYRTKSEEKLFDPHLIDCNSLCNFDILENSIFLSSRHYLMKADLRNLQKVSHFSHSLNMPPCYMDFATKGDDTFLCLTSQSEDNKILFTGNSSYGLPYRVPGIQETLKECRLRNSSLVLFDTLDERLNFSTAGLKVINLDGEVYIYWSNCLGEIFRQRIYEDEHDRTMNEPIEALLEWVNNLEKPKPVLHVTNIKEMSRARFSLNSDPIERNLSRYKVESKADDFLKKMRPRYCTKNVKGNLAKDFLAVWDDDDDDDEEEDSEQLPEVAPHDKVNTWIQNHDFSDDETDLGLGGAAAMDTSRTSMIKFSPSGYEGGNEVTKKMYCSRQLLHITECMNTSVLDCAVTFTCDKNVCVYGIQVPAQIPMEDDRQPQFIYPELLYAHLLDADGSRLTYTHFTSRVNYRSLIEISFNRPVYIQRNKVYKVGVVLNKIGCYPIGTYPNQSTCNGVVFSFSQGQCGDSVRDGLIRSIIFSIPSANNNSSNPGVPGDHNKMPNII
ncbi:hypothetical protein NQ314_007195 [Rhamnusium bicolor]|uniref:BACK domain-containing protein n=1 Tax=Rhamnusium bicolor TaxID=1586634 RepID=A0AAV8YR78_9CUCU|nr:hypothetical protein NQ314_007195 [Rhamnusium bicolor]